MARFFFYSICMFLLLTTCKQNNKTAKVVTAANADTLALISGKMQGYINQRRLPGMSLLAIKNGNIIYNERFGFSDIADKKMVEESSIYRIFSMTKPITAVALMTLYDKGKFKLDDKLSKYIPEFEHTLVYSEIDGKHSTEPQVNEMTIRHLLTHTSGIGYGWGDSYVATLYRDSMFIDDPLEIEGVVKRLAKIPLKNQPGTTWEYGHSLDVIGYLIEVLSEKPLDEYFESAIFSPLEMNDTGFSVPKEKRNRLVEIYTLDEEQNLIPHSMSVNEDIKNEVTLFMGGAGLVSTITDYGKFCTMLLNKGELNGQRILQETTVELILTNQLPKGVKYEDGKGHGLGGAIDLETREYFWGGSASTKFWINQNNDLIVIAFSQLMPANSEFAENFKSIIENALRSDYE